MTVHLVVNHRDICQSRKNKSEIIVFRLNEHIENSVVDACESQQSECSAVEKFPSLFDKAHSVADSKRNHLGIDSLSRPEKSEHTVNKADKSENAGNDISN